MTEKEINIKVFEFVEKLKVFEQAKNVPEKPKLKGSTEHLSVIDLTDRLIEGPIIRTSFMPELSDYKITISIKSIKYGFDDHIYIDFYRFIYRLSQYNSLHEKVSIRYLKEKTLFWIISVYVNNKAEQNFLSYLLEKLEKEIKPVIYYYPIINLGIEHPFKIGIAEFTFFTKEYFDQFWENKKIEGDISKEHFDAIYRKHQGRVFVSIEVCAEEEKREEISYKLACLATDIIKLLSPTIYHPDDNCLIDLEKRMPFRSEYFSMDLNKEFDFNISISANQGPFFFSAEKYSNIENNMIKLFGKIVNNNSKNPIDNLIIDSIKFFAKSISEIDLHLRISHLIMIIESIFLLDNEDFRMEKKCKRRMTDFLYFNDGKAKQNLTEVLTEMYRIRHKMTHKSIREYIELKILREFQTKLVEVILTLLNKNDTINNKEKLIEHLDREIKTNA